MITAQKDSNPNLITFEKKGVSDEEMLDHARKTITVNVKQIHKKRAINWKYKVK